ncbi:MAG: VWA domain-containing protein, partial [Bacteroidia bacterium]|nr:VWA domain-containing protein [Bacteroidia bacterium]
NVSAHPGGNVPIFFIPDGPTGGVQITGYGRGERHEETSPSHDSFSNSDPFLIDGSYLEPDYDPFWFCNSPPHWDNVALLPNGDIRKTIAPAICMLVSVHGDHVSTCSATLIGSDLVISAAHCIDAPSDIESMSVFFNYQTDQLGNAPGGYSPDVYKVIELVNHGPLGVGSNTDYMIVRIETPPAGTGINPVPMRASRPAVGEQVFGIHHPNGAVKKVSPSIADGFAQVIANTGTGRIPTQFDVSGGTSGSGLFDMQGRFCGVLSAGQGGPFAPLPGDQNPSCRISYAASENILNDIANDAPLSPARDVMLVFDRSGSMSQLTPNGITKLQEAKNAASLFVELTRTDGGDQIGLVTFSSTASSAFDLDDVNIGNKNTLIGDTAPFTDGIVGGITAGGTTTIGGGLSVARDQMNLHGIGGNQRTIFLLTDGLQNTNPLVESVDDTLFNTDVFAVGYGTEAGLNGTLLTELAENHDGLYMRAENGLTLLKFFALTFGNIFEAGTLNDPEFVLPKTKNEADPYKFMVCEETTITIVLGWEKASSPLNFRIQTPAGTFISTSDRGIVSSFGTTWRFARITLPHNGEQNGEWKVVVHRVQTGGEFPPPPEDITYFVNVLAKDGPRIFLNSRKRRYYTGDSYNPLVTVATKDGFRVPNASIQLTITKPTDGSGNILSKTKYVNQTEEIDGDIIPARIVALKKIEANMGGVPLISFETENISLVDDGTKNDGAMEPDGIFGEILPDLFKHEGHYTFRAVANYGAGCTGTREISWSVYVDPGIDGSNTTITTEVIETLPSGKSKIKITITPKDKYGNLVGPGRVDMIDLTGVPGTSLGGAVKDNGDGTYGVVVIHDPASGNSPGVVVNQPDREPTVLTPTKDDGSGSSFPGWLIWLLLLIILILILILIFK